MKRITSLTIIILMLLALLPAGVFAAESPMTPEEVQNQAEWKSIQAVIDDLDIKTKESALKQARADAVNQGDAYGAQEVLNHRIIRNVKPLEAEAAVESAKRTKKDHATQARQNAYSQIQKLFLLERQEKYETQKLAIVQERMSMAKIRYAAKSITDDDLSTAEYNLESKQLDISNIAQQKVTVQLELHRLLNRPLTSSAIEISGELNLEKMTAVNLDEKIASALKRNTGVYSKEKSAETARITMELTAKLYKEGDLTYDDNYFNQESAKAMLEDAVRSLESDIRNKYNSLLSSKSKLEVAQENVSLLQKKLAIMETKFNTGGESKDSLMNARETLLDAKYSYDSAVCDFNIVLREFDDMSY